MTTPLRRATGRPLPVAGVAMGRTHAPFLVLLLAGAVLRALVFVGFRPALWFLGDSAAYLQAALDLRPVPERPIAGSIVWSLLRPLHRLEAITVVQHVSGLLITVAVYVLLLRLGAPRWAAVLGAAPMALDGLVVTLEQSLVAEPVFMALGMVAIGLLMWFRDRPPVPAVAFAGLAAGAAAVTRSTGICLVVAICAVLVARRVGAVRLLVAFAACSLPLLAYAAVFAQVWGAFSITESTGQFLYGRLAGIADCSRFTVPPEEAGLCPTQPRAARPDAQFWTWSADSPYFTALPSDPGQAERISLDWSRRVIAAQPGDYAALAARDLGHTLSPRPDPGLHAFATSYPPLPAYAEKPALAYQHGRPGDTQVDGGLQPFLSAYQRFTSVPGLTYWLALLLGLLGVVFGRDRTGRGLRSWTALLVLAGAGMLVLPALLAGYDPRYLVPVLPLLSMAAVLGGILLSARVGRQPAGEVAGAPAAAEPNTSRDVRAAGISAQSREPT